MEQLAALAVGGDSLQVSCISLAILLKGTVEEVEEVGCEAKAVLEEDGWDVGCAEDCEMTGVVALG